MLCLGIITCIQDQMSFSYINHCLHAYYAETLAIDIQISYITLKDMATISKKKSPNNVKVYIDIEISGFFLDIIQIVFNMKNII